VPRKVQIVCATMGFLFVVFLFGGIICAHFLPPVGADWSADRVAAHYRDHAGGIRLGAVLMMLGAGMTAPWSALLAAHMKRIEGSFSPLTYMYLIASAAGFVAIFMPVMIFMAASYRPERAPELTQLLNDLAWIPFITNGPPAIVQALSFGTAVLSDRSAKPAFPRWVGYFNYWEALSFLPACILVFFKTGPFAWHGALSFWLPATTFGTWFIVMGVMMLRALPPKSDRPTGEDDEIILRQLA